MPEKSVIEKLTLKRGQTFLLLNAPEGYRRSLGTLPEGVKLVSAGPVGGARIDMIQIFIGSREELESRVAPLKERLSPRGIVWVTYPKGTSKIKGEINRDSIRDYAATVGLEAVAIFSIDDDWSALRLKVADLSSNTAVEPPCRKGSAVRVAEAARSGYSPTLLTLDSEIPQLHDTWGLTLM